MIKEMAYHDPLTELPTRRLFDDRLSLAITHARRNKQMLAVMFLDLDKFKDINDTLGHAMGDQLLKSLGERLRSSLREEDTVARMGGDEFILLLSEITRREDVTTLARKVLESIREPLTLDGHELLATTSIGIAFYPNDGEDAETLLKNADAAMYRAKEQGRNNFQFYS
jgi:diguanylate cyclase (GGDEF)-like protein